MDRADADVLFSPAKKDLTSSQTLAVSREFEPIFFKGMRLEQDTTLKSNAIRSNTPANLC